MEDRIDIGDYKMPEEDGFKRMSGSGLDLFRSIASVAIRAQEKRPGDYIATDGLLHCGVCKEARREYHQFEEMIGEEKRITPVEITRACKCDRERREEEERRKKAEAEMQRIQKLKKQSLMDAKFTGVSFDTLQLTQHNQKNLKLCRSYAKRFDEMLAKSQGLLMWGNVGTGKSYAAAAIANFLLAQKVPVVMTSFVKIVEDIQLKKINESDFLDSLSYAKLVIFDDLGAERGTDFAAEIVYNAIDDRYRKKLPMIITTNKTLPEMQEELNPKYSRIYDRIFEVCYPMQFTGPSWRRKIAASNYDAMQSLLEDEE